MPQEIVKKCRAGFTMTEMSIVLALIGVVLSTVWAVAAKVSEQQKSNDAYNQLGIIVENILTLKHSQGKSFSSTSWNVITDDMIKADAIPQTFLSKTTSTKANSPWKPDGFIVSEKYDGAAQKGAFRIVFEDPTPAGCVALILRATSCEAGQMACPYKVHTKNGSQSKDPDATKGWATMTTKQAADLCDENTESSSSVGFDYYL
ncbi:MAG: prepilin-type N-terminal cleavage/methylation domain-containing protein [Bdellovibrionales bacterium]